MHCSYDGLYGFVGSSQELLTYIPAHAQTPLATSPDFDGNLSIEALRKQYASGRSRPTDVSGDD